ncbi:rhodanese-like domain-containing protein [Deinococcus sp. YIM 77859]|uniref:rhodanese-like domain-containing protein n=1 Tax=Deinococcus sp. YIM 77859 TaxID=1540221 RepID=UPI0005573802|nr:rhodanese-like domain-containing protein [Deinococcus sp. YIM 77859]
MTLPAHATLIDLRPAELRCREPLEEWLTLPVLALTLEAIENGTHGLRPEAGPLVVICERGVRSGLAAQYLRADGLEAWAYPGGVPALRRALQQGRPEDNSG